MQVSDEVIKVLEYLCGKIGVTIDWTSSNVLPYVQQLCEKYIKWEIQTSIAWIVIAVIAVVITFIFTRVINIDGLENLIFWCVLVIAVFTICYQVFDIIECCTFPEKAIYDYIRTNLNSNSKF